MRRPLVVSAAVAATLVSACGQTSVPISPVAFVRTAAGKTAALKTYRLDLKLTMTGKIALGQCRPDGELPPAVAAVAGAAAANGKPISAEQKAQLCAQLAQHATAPPQDYSLKIQGSGSFRAPSDYSLQISETPSSSSSAAAPAATINVQTIRTGGVIYIKNSLSGHWTTLDKAAPGIDPSVFNNVNGGAYDSLLDAAKSAKDVGDTTIGGTKVHHYQVTVDPDYLVQHSAKKPVFKDPAMQQLIQQYAASLKNSSTTVETWVGVDDQILRRMVFDLAGPPPAATAGTSGQASPISGLKEHFEIDLHDLNSRVDITAPKVS
jgi:hypothetical protein